MVDKSCVTREGWSGETLIQGIRTTDKGSLEVPAAFGLDNLLALVLYDLF